MNHSFEKPILKKQRIPLNAKIVFPLIVVLAIVLLVSALLDYWGLKRELSHILKEQSNSLITALEKGSHNALASYDLVQDIVAERLLDNARLLEELDSVGRLDEAYLQEISKKNQIFRINVYDANGNKVMASFRGFGWGATKPAPADLMASIRRDSTDELVMGFRASRFGESRRFAVAKKRRKGGVIVLNVDSQEMLDFRRSIGLGKLMRDIGENEGVAYIALQDTSKIIIATEGVDSLSTHHSDPVLATVLESGQTVTRFVKHNDQYLYEINHLFNAENGEILRFGLNASHIKEAQKSALTRAGLSSFLLLIFGVIGAGWVISSQNVRSLQDAYQRIETYTGSMLENMTDAIVAVNGSGDITLMNAAAEHLFGIPAIKVIGKSCALELVAICPYLKDGLETAQEKVYNEERLKSPRGELTTFISVNVINNDQKNPDIVFAVIRDMTDIKRLEENMKRKDQITAMGHLASGVAHEIRNPLNAIGMIGQRLKAEFTPAAEKSEYSQLTSTIVTESQRINKIIHQFLEFARPAELIKTTFNVKHLLDDVAAMLSPQAEAKGIRFIYQCKDTRKIRADYDKIKGAFLNLGQNALDACSDGDKITLICDEESEAIRIRIADTGCGIPDQVRDKIFNLYFTTKESGTGIGLSLVQQIISQHNGTINVYAEENKGSTFTVSLPVI